MWIWLRENSDVISIILSLIGFGLIWHQARRARSAAEASQLATSRALGLMSHRLTIADLSSISSSMGEVQTALRGGRVETALLRTQDIREQLVRLRGRPGFNTRARLTEIQTIVVDLAKLQSGLERSLFEDTLVINVSKANDLIADQISQLGEWGEHVRFASRSVDE